MGQLIAFRMVQGLGAGSLITMGMTIVGDLYGLERRAKMQGYISGVWGLASLVGPLLGGVLTDQASWRWVFYVNVPFGLLAMVLIARGAGPPQVPGRRPTIDVAGLASSRAASRPCCWASSRRAAPGVAAARGGRAGVAGGGSPRGLIRGPRAARASRSSPCDCSAIEWCWPPSSPGSSSGMAMFGAISFVPLFMQAVRGTSAMVAGFVLTPFVLGWVGMSVTSARLVLRTGLPRPGGGGMACLAVAFLLLRRAGRRTLTPGAAMAHALWRDGHGAGLRAHAHRRPERGAPGRPRRGDVDDPVLPRGRRRLGLSVMGAVMAQRLFAGMAVGTALHGVFVAGAGVCGLALLSAFLVPAGRARDLARAELRGEPTRAGG